MLVYVRRGLWSCSAAVSRRHSTSLPFFIHRPSLSCSAIVFCFLSSLMAVVGITTLITAGVVKVEFGLAGIVKGCKVC